MKTTQNNKAFTLIELLTVVAIIAMLIAMFGAGLSKVKIIQRNLQQKAALKAMDVGLELFSKDFQEYPDSAPVSGGGTWVCGAQRLAEALVGRDEQGFHPKSKWHPQSDTADLYTDATLKDRKPEYVDLKRCGAYTIHQLWVGSNGSSAIYDSAGATTGTQRAPVITDVFNRNKVTIAGQSEKVGSPVLYFKADSSRRFRLSAANRVVTNPTYNDYKEWIYKFSDNMLILQLPWIRNLPDITDGMTTHYAPGNAAEGPNAQVFYENLTQRQDPAQNLYKPFNPSTFVLISAGWDGIYGTKDDITNFNY